MSVVSTTSVDGIEPDRAAAVRRLRPRLLPYALLAPSLLFLALFTYLPVVRVAIESLYDKPHGTGLGLPISRQIVGHFGGRLWVESDPGKGATFSFTVPLRRASVDTTVDYSRELKPAGVAP